MKRRTFMGLTTAMALLPFSGYAAETVDYTPGLIADALADGKVVFVDYAAVWCSTCARQERIIEQLRAENPAYEDILFVRVDWDTYAGHSVTTSRNIPRRSTLILLKGDAEHGRIVAGTSVAEIKALLDMGLALS